MDITRNSLAVRSSVLVLLALVITTCYANSFSAAWQLDDKPNIVNNTYLHLDSMHPHKLVNTLFTDHENPGRLSNKMYRPVPSLSFALNWYVGQDRVFGYHLVNTAIHALTAFFLFLFNLHLLETPKLRAKSTGKPVFIALLASLLWAVHPIQTQAVTYIVQRMAQLAALFYMLGLYAYLKARLSAETNKRMAWLIACAVFYLLGVHSKPNAAMLPMALVLVEMLFFQNLADNRIRKRFMWGAAMVAVLIAVLGAALFLSGEPFSFLDMYHARTFSLIERLMTQPRVVLFYLSQILLPLPSRFSIAHDVIVSTGWLTPWATLPSALMVIVLVGFAVTQMVKRPLLAFAILFYFLNHIIESSVIALEMIFEHRNYLPSFFLSLPLAALLGHWWQNHLRRYRVAQVSVVAVSLLLVTLLSVSTVVRNRVWQDETTLWMDAASKAPNHSRPLHVLGVNLAWGKISSHSDRHAMALQLFEDALDKYMPSTNVEADIYGNMALIQFHHTHNPQKAFANFKEALKINPGYHKIRRDYVNALTLNRDFDSALEQVDILLTKSGLSGRDLNLKGHVLLWLNRPQEALPCFQRAVPLLADKSNVMLNYSVALSMAGKHAEAEKLLTGALKQYPHEIPFYMAIIENSVRAEAHDRAFTYARQLLEHFNSQAIRSGIAEFSNNPRFAPLGVTTIWPQIEALTSPATEGN